MPDIMLYILIVFWIVFVLNMVADTREPYPLILLIPLLAVGAWINTAWKENAKEPYIYGTYKAIDVDGTMVLKVDGMILNLNDVLNKNISVGQEFEVSTYQKFDNGIFFLCRKAFEFKEVNSPTGN